MGIFTAKLPSSFIPSLSRSTVTTKTRGVIDADAPMTEEEQRSPKGYVLTFFHESSAQAALKDAKLATSWTQNKKGKKSDWARFLSVSRVRTPGGRRGWLVTATIRNLKTEGKQADAFLVR